VAFIFSSAACAQAKAVKKLSQTDVAVSLYGTLNKSTSAASSITGTVLSPSNAAGALIEFRQISKPWIGYEGTIALNRANQAYSSQTLALCGVCAATTVQIPVSANAREVTGDWIASLKIMSFRPFALAGGGLLMDKPTSGQATTTTDTISCGGNPNCTLGTTTSTVSTSSSNRVVYVYGAGLDWNLLPHIGLRFQYRGNVYKAPNLLTGFTSISAFTRTSEPMLGAYFRF
jgi:opacity protein-like surface antigen